MSGALKVDTLAAIRDSQGLTPQEKLVLWTVYSRGKQHTAGLKTLANDMGYEDDRQTRRFIAALKDRNIIDVVERTGRTHVITINTHVLQTLVAQDTPVAQDKGGMSPTTRGGSRTRQPKEKEKVKEKENLASAGAAADKESDSNKQDAEHSLISEGQKERGEAAKQEEDSLSNKTDDGAGEDPKEQEGTLVVQDKGGEIDYAAEAEKAGITYYYESALNTPTVKGEKRSPKSAYKTALRSAGKETS